MVAGREYPLDVLVLSTGYETPDVGGGSPAARAGVAVHGRGGRSFDDKWQSHGAATLHGVCAHGFPNLFFAPQAQSGQSANFGLTLDVGAEHVAHIIATAEARVGGGGGGGAAAAASAVVEVTSEAEEAWSAEIIRRATWSAALVGCTPGYITSEGEVSRMPADPAAQMRRARGGVWTEGIASFMRVLQEYRADASLRGIEVAPVKAA